MDEWELPLLEVDAEETWRRRYGLLSLSRMERISASRSSCSEASIFQRLA